MIQPAARASSIPGPRSRREPRPAAGSVRLRVAEPLNEAASRSLLSRLGPLDPHARVVLDLRDAEYADSAGIRMLQQLRSALESTGGELSLVLGEGSKIRRALRLLRFHDQFRITAD